MATKIVCTVLTQFSGIDLIGLTTILNHQLFLIVNLPILLKDKTNFLQQQTDCCSSKIFCDLSNKLIGYTWSHLTVNRLKWSYLCLTLYIETYNKVQTFSYQWHSDISHHKTMNDYQNNDVFHLTSPGLQSC